MGARLAFILASAIVLNGCQAQHSDEQLVHGSVGMQMQSKDLSRVTGHHPDF